MEKIGDILKKSDLIELAPRWKRIGYVAISNRIIFHKNLSIGAKTLYCCLLSRCFQKNNCFPGQQKISQELKISIPTINKLTQELIGQSLLKTKRRGQGKTKVYILRF